MNTRVRPQTKTMRKVPRQQRSRAMVDAIVEAATRILGRRGWAAFTTNEVAHEAGVSVGSLYQYFPNKLALAEAIRQRHLQTVLTALSNVSDSPEPETLDARVVHLIEGVVAAHSVDPALHRVLLDEVPLVSREKYAEFESEYQRRYSLVVASSLDSRDTGHDAVAGHVLAAAVEGVVHAAVRQGDIGSGALKNELFHMVRGYLRDRGASNAQDR